METKHPMSFKIVLIFLGIVLAMSVFFVLPSKGFDKSEMLLPDNLLPWNSDVKEVVDVLNEIYQYKGKATQWAMCETGAPGLFQMCLQDHDKAGPFKFIFSDGKLTGYIAEFPASKYEQLIRSGKDVYLSRGVVKSASREFRVYEMQIRNGHLELFMVYDKDTQKVRLQTKYKYIDKKKTKVEEPSPKDGEVRDDTEPNMESDTYVGTINCLNILTLDPLSSPNVKSMEDLSKRLTFFVLVRALSPIN